MGVAPPRLVPNLVGSLAVLVVVAAVGVGLPVLDRAVGADRPLPAGVPYRIGAGVSLVPPAGATLDAGRTRPGRDHATAVFQAGGVRLAVQATRFDGTLATAADRMRTKLAFGMGCRLTGTGQPSVTAAGVPGVAGGYVTRQGTGRYAVYVAGGIAVEATIDGPVNGPPRAQAAVQDSLASLTIEGRR
jgi:hypothetical protein